MHELVQDTPKGLGMITSRLYALLIWINQHLLRAIAALRNEWVSRDSRDNRIDVVELVHFQSQEP